MRGRMQQLEEPMRLSRELYEAQMREIEREAGFADIMRVSEMRSATLRQSEEAAADIAEW